MPRSGEYKKSLFTVLFFARFLGAGPSYDRLRKKLRHVHVWQGYHLVFCVGMCYLYHLSFSRTYVPKFPYSDYLLYVTSAFIIRLILTITVLRLVFTSTKRWEEMLTYIVEVEEELIPYYDLPKLIAKTQTILGYLKRFALLISLAISESIIAREPYGERILFEGIPLFQVNLLMVIIDDVATIINADFQLINRVLTKDYIRTDLTKNAEPININKVSNIYTKIYKIMDLFSELFGWEIVLMNVLAVISSLPALEKIICHQFEDKRIVSVMIISVWKTTLCMVVTKTCHHTAKKGKEFGALLFKISNRLPHTFEFEPIRGDIQFLRELYNEFTPEFSAAGVFTIDYSVYYALFTLSMSYLVILIQFKYADAHNR